MSDPKADLQYCLLSGNTSWRRFLSRAFPWKTSFLLKKLSRCCMWKWASVTPTANELLDLDFPALMPGIYYARYCASFCYTNTLCICKTYMERAWTKLFWPRCMWCPFSTLLVFTFPLCLGGRLIISERVCFLLRSQAFWVKPLQSRYRDSKRTRKFLAILAFISFLKMQLFHISDVLPKASVIPWQTILSSQPMKAVEYNMKWICFLMCPFFNARPPLAVPYSSPEF